MHHHYQPPHLIEKDFGLSKDGKSTWSLRRRGRNAKTAQSSVGVGGTPTQPNFESRVRRSKFSQFARDGMLVMACIMQMFYPMNSMACIMWMLYPMTNFWHLRTHGARDAARCFFACRLRGKAKVAKLIPRLITKVWKMKIRKASQRSSKKKPDGIISRAVSDPA